MTEFLLTERELAFLGSVLGRWGLIDAKAEWFEVTMGETQEVLRVEAMELRVFAEELRGILRRFSRSDFMDREDWEALEFHLGGDPEGRLFFVLDNLNRMTGPWRRRLRGVTYVPAFLLSEFNLHAIRGDLTLVRSIVARFYDDSLDDA
jgi:hypothetical protein